MNRTHLLEPTGAPAGLRQFGALVLPALALALFASPALALEPPPGGGYIDETTALGEDALLHSESSSTGQNTALGFEALYENTIGAKTLR